MDFSEAKTSTIFARYVIPQMIGLVFNSVYFIVDGIFIGRRLGTAALAAAGVAVPVVEIMIALSMLISVGAGVLISSAMGRGDAEDARASFHHAILFSLVLSLLVAVPGNLLLPQLARALGASEAILPDTLLYLRYFISFCPFLVFSFVLSTLARNDGKPGLAMWALTIGSLSNVVLDYVFLYPLNLGIGGAALATGLGPVFSVIILLPHFLRRKGNLYFGRAPFQWKRMGKILMGGTPAFISEFSIGFVTLLYNLSIVRQGLGDDGLASYLVIGYASLICLTAFLGAAQGVQPVVSYLVGAKQPHRIRSLFRSSILFCAVLAAVFYLSLAFGGVYFFRIFIDGNQSLLSYTADVARIYFVNLPFAACNILLLSFLQSMEKVGGSLVLSLSRSTLPVVAALSLLPVLLPGQGLWWAMAAAEAFTLVIGVLLWTKAWQPDRRAISSGKELQGRA